VNEAEDDGRATERIPYRKLGYGTKAAADLLTDRGLFTTARSLRYAANHGRIRFEWSSGGHRRFMADELERYLREKLDKADTGV